jgi:hypothetical protein
MREHAREERQHRQKALKIVTWLTQRALVEAFFSLTKPIQSHDKPVSVWRVISAISGRQRSFEDSIHHRVETGRCARLVAALHVEGPLLHA